MQPNPTNLFSHHDREFAISQRPFDIETIRLAPAPNGIVPRRLREWQQKAMVTFGGKRYTNLVAATGSGKTTLILFRCLRISIDSNVQKKCLIIVPKCNIGLGFTRTERQRSHWLELDGKTYEINVAQNDLVDDSETDKEERLERFLRTPVASCHRKAFERDGILSGNIMVTTHQAIAKVWENIMTNGWTLDVDPRKDRDSELVPDPRKDLTVHADEAHHLLGVFDSVKDDFVYSLGVNGQNRLGKFCHSIMNDDEGNSELHLTSATPFRGDRRAILSEEARAKMEPFTLSFVDHLATTGIERLGLTYITYDFNPIPTVLAEIAKEPNECHLIFVPSISHGYRRCMDAGMTELVEGLKKLYPKPGQILNLLGEENQTPENTERLFKQTKARMEDAEVRVVITCRLVIEGVDWVPCSRIHNTSFGGSLPQEIQKIGRMTRPIEGKTYIRSLCYIARKLADVDGMVLGNNGEVLEAEFQQVACANAVVMFGMQFDEDMSSLYSLPYPGALAPRAPVLGSRADLPQLEETTEAPKLRLADIAGEKLFTIREEINHNLGALPDLNERSVRRLIAAVADSHLVYKSPGERSMFHEMMLMSVTRTGGGSNPMARLWDFSALRELGMNYLLAEIGATGNSIYTGNYSGPDLAEFKRVVLKATEKQRAESAVLIRSKTGIHQTDGKREYRRIKQKQKAREKAGVTTKRDQSVRSLLSNQTEGR